METGVVVRPRDVAVLAVNGLLAFALNYVSFTANRKAGALSMTVAGMSHISIALIWGPGPDYHCLDISDSPARSFRTDFIQRT